MNAMVCVTLVGVNLCLYGFGMQCEWTVSTKGGSHIWQRGGQDSLDISIISLEANLNSYVYMMLRLTKA